MAQADRIPINVIVTENTVGGTLRVISCRTTNPSEYPTPTQTLLIIPSRLVGTSLFFRSCVMETM